MLQKVVALTGSATFIGSNLIGLLEEDPHVSRVISFDRSRPETSDRKTEHVTVDLAHPSAEDRLAEVLIESQAGILVHLGFAGSPSFDTVRAHEFESVGTLRVLNACRRAQVRRLVHWSQTLLYGAYPNNPNFLEERQPLRAKRDEPFFRDKIEAEAEVARFMAPGRSVTVLRTAAILGPTIQNYLTRYLSHRVVPVILGFDPLWQFLHEADAVTAFKLAIDRDAPGVFNIVGRGVLPLSMVIKLAGRVALPMPRPLVDAITGTLWLAHVADMPPSFFDYLQYLCVADGQRAAGELGFIPAFSTREALLDYANAQHVRDAQPATEYSA